MRIFSVRLNSFIQFTFNILPVRRPYNSLSLSSTSKIFWIELTNRCCCLFSILSFSTYFCFHYFLVVFFCLFQRTHWQRRTEEIETKYTRNWYFLYLIALSLLFYFFSSTTNCDRLFHTNEKFVRRRLRIALKNKRNQKLSSREKHDRYETHVRWYWTNCTMSEVC